MVLRVNSGGGTATAGEEMAAYVREFSESSGKPVVVSSASINASAAYEISSQDAPDCCTLFMPRSPETHAKLPVVREAESVLPVERWVAELVEAAEVRDYACPAYKPKKKRAS